MPRLASIGAIPEGRKNTKSRNGCQRCKQKRLKCDETKPGCKNCQSRNISCPGYEKSLKWSTKYEVFPSFDPSSNSIKSGTKRKQNRSSVVQITLPPDVASSFKALAAVLPSVGPIHSDSVYAADSACEAQEDAKSFELQTPTSEMQTQEDELPPTEACDTANVIDTVELLETVDFLADNQVTAMDYPASRSLDFLDFNSLGGFQIEDLDFLPDDQVILPADDRLSRSLLRNYYRLPSVSLNSYFNDTNTMLVEHYFRDVCTLFSSFDSSLNPFRVSIGRIWDSSPSIYYAIQSMAAAQLANTFPHMGATGVEMQKKAYECLNEEMELIETEPLRREKIMLTILLLGLTTCWHDSGDLGLNYLTAARSLILPRLMESSPSDTKETQRTNQFFEESLIYWEMLIGFVSQESVTFSPEFGSRSKSAFSGGPIGVASRMPDGRFCPHPWTGIAPRVQMLFAEVGRLVCHERMSLRSGLFDPVDMEEKLSCAIALEEELLAAQFPQADELADPGDDKTSKQDFVVLAEAYRSAGLLELYRVFPATYHRRLGAGTLPWEETINESLPPLGFDPSSDNPDANVWITSMALYIVDLLKSLPASSGTCCLQPILLVTASTELKRVPSVDYYDVYVDPQRINHARSFVERRLNEFALRLPAKPLRRMLELVKEVWKRMDAGEDVFWLDVMFENGWETVMG
ncbi:hypothetical protein K432DRAFT_321533 [Lepidopterella palustris CBS 459.81]|uniref:Zn(2)-C6 fungal-type domain-containing protein n=1 Tax=Lepidopterella palustris CBS 459.81 TaxID=1314670 RepID=A0A8E2EGW2_9PEZI|nr:hypothetical protein K432DRAFT_321533 [Lepidopterella palustris CBS 459.81]